MPGWDDAVPEHSHPCDHRLANTILVPSDVEHRCSLLTASLCVDIAAFLDAYCRGDRSSNSLARPKGQVEFVPPA